MFGARIPRLLPATRSRLAIGLAIVAGWMSIVGGATRPPAARTPASCLVSVCLAGAAEAMGGEAKLRSIVSTETSGVSVWYHREQSERPEGPWLASFTDFTDLRSFGAQTVRRSFRARGFSTNDWIDSATWTPSSTIVAASGLAFVRGDAGFEPAPMPPDLEALFGRSPD